MDLGTSACPPYHLAIVIGGTSAEANLAAVKKASAGYLDHLPTSGNEGGRAFRDLEWEEKVLKICQESGVGAQFGGKYLVHDVRVIRMPRHAASCPVGIGVSCSADRNVKAKITEDGIFLEQLEKNPARFLPKTAPGMKPAVDIDLDEGMDKVREILSKYPVKTRLNLKGTLIVARDIAHARIKQMLDEGKPMPEYFKNHPIYYAGPAKTPQGMASGSFGPTTAGRMDPYVDLFQDHGGSLVMVAKGNRSQAVTDACRPATASRKSKWSIFPSWAWRPCARSTSKTSPPLSSLTTKATISSPSSRNKMHQRVFDSYFMFLKSWV